jgi:hypothetical protein
LAVDFNIKRQRRRSPGSEKPVPSFILPKLKADEKGDQWQLKSRTAVLLQCSRAEVPFLSEIFSVTVETLLHQTSGDCDEYPYIAHGDLLLLLPVSG